MLIDFCMVLWCKASERFLVSYGLITVFIYVVVVLSGTVIREC